MRKFEFEVLGMGMKSGDYSGSFTKPVEDKINSLLRGSLLHLYSGSSRMGDVRVDIDHPNATESCDVKEFISKDTRHWDWALLDPPYNLSNRTRDLLDYPISCPLSADVAGRRLLKLYFQRYVDNVLWLDICAPSIKGFRREKLWLLLPGGFHPVRVLSWLKKEMQPLL